jgi:hypothetical protein
MYVLIPTYRRGTLLQRTLATLAAANRPEQLNQVWVLENGDSQEASEVCLKFQKQLPLKYEYRKQAGKGRALQWAIEQIREGLLVLLDDDVVVDSALLTAYARAAAIGPGHYFGGTVLPTYEQAPPDWLLPHLPPCTTGFMPQPASDPKQVFLGANMAAFAQDLLASGGFDPRFGPGSQQSGTAGNPTGQETVMQHRLLQHGCRSVSVPDAKVLHHIPAENVQPRWALHRRSRTYASMVLMGIGAQGGMLEDRMTLKVRGRLLLTGLRTLASCACRDPQTRFEKQLDWYKLRGQVEGLRLLHKRAA